MKKNESVITIGTFDGVHKGHRLLISKAIFSAKLNNLKSVLIALEKPLRKVSGLLSLSDEKIEDLKELGADEIIIIPSNSNILKLTPEKFLKDFLIDLFNVYEIICGVDFAFGKERKGDVKWLKAKTKENNIKLSVVKPLKIKSKQVSSSFVRSLIEKGDIKQANKFLGKNYSFSGIPYKDRGVGKKIGFPTVNINVDNLKLLPKGVYVSTISQGKNLYPSVTSIGTRPTFKNLSNVVAETHILGFSKNWSPKKTTVSLLSKIRNEKKFKSIEELQKQISKDIGKTKKYFSIKD